MLYHVQFSILADYSQQPDDEMIITNDDKHSDQIENLRKVLEFSLKVSQCDQFLSITYYKTHIEAIVLEDIKMWIQIFDTNELKTLTEIFHNNETKSIFYNYLMKCLKLFIDSDCKITPNQLFTVLNIFCESVSEIFSTVKSIYSKDLKHLEKRKRSIYSGSIYFYSGNFNFDDNDLLDILHSNLNEQLLIKILCNKSPLNNPFNGIIGDESWLARVVYNRLISILCPDLFKEYSVSIPSSDIEISKTVARDCLSTMIRSKDTFKPEHLWCIFYACSNTCQDLYDITEKVNPDNSNDVASNLSFMYSILTPELMLDLFCLKSPSGSPFCGKIKGDSWLFQVSDCGLFSVISTELTEQYVKQNHPDKFDQNKKVAVECITNMTKSKDKFNPEHFYQVLFACSNSCQDIYDILIDLNQSDLNTRLKQNKNEISVPNLIFLNLELLPKELFVNLMLKKSNQISSFHGHINNKPWLSWIIESDQLYPTFLPYIFANKQQDIKNMIKASKDNFCDVSRTLIPLLLDKTDNQRMLRREFFMLLTDVKNCNDAIAYIKTNSEETSIVSLKSVQEIKDLYNFTQFQKVKIFATLLLTFLVGSLSYVLDVGADYKLLHNSYNCNLTNFTISTSNCLNETDFGNFTNLHSPFNDSTNKSMINNQSELCSNSTSTCLKDNDFCNFTIGSVSYYFEYTLIVCLMPFLLNILLIANNIYKNKENSLVHLPILILNHYSVHDKHPYLYRMLCIVNWTIWCPFLIAIYPIATKLAYVGISYMVQVTSRSLTGKKETPQEKSNLNKKEVLLSSDKSEKEKEDQKKKVDEKTFYDRINRALSSEVIKSSTLEVVTESTLQPLLQLYAITSTCDFSHQFTFGNLFSTSLFSDALLFSIVTSLLSFSWSMTTYNVSNKQGALNTDVGLTARLLMFLYFLAYIISRMFILIISAHQVLGRYENFLFFIAIHAFLMCIIHNIHLYKMNIGGNYGSFTTYVKTNYKSLGFWVENLINSVGCILIPNNIKYPRKVGDKVNKRYHEATSFRYLSMHLTFLIENVVLVIMCQLNFTLESPLHESFEKKNNSFIRTFPYWSLGLFLSALILKFLYYQSHAWPISPNCFTMKFLCPFDEIRNGDECRREENVEQIEGKLEVFIKVFINDLCINHSPLQIFFIIIFGF